MSLAKIHVVQKSQKDQGECGSCKTPLPKGSAYLWFTVGFRSSYKYKRCLDSQCYPKQSERESSKIATVYAAQEDFDVSEATTLDDIEQAVHDVADTVREVADEYREAAINPNTGEIFNTDSDERADTLESSADELESWEYDGSEFEPCDEHEEVDYTPLEQDENGYPKFDCQECDQAFAQFIEDVRTAAVEAVDSIETP